MKKMLFDLVMTVMIILLMCLNITGLNIHEIMGVAIFFFFLIHNIINFKWIKAITLNFKKANMKSKVMYILNILLFISTTATVVTGILISKTILTNITIPNSQFLNSWHTAIAYWSLIIISIHIGLHWKMILEKLMKLFEISKENIIVKVSCKVIYAFIAITAIFSMVKGNFANKLVPIGKTDGEFNSGSDTSISNNSTEVITNTTTNTTTPANTISNTQTSIPTLEDYLGNLHCDGCGRHCLLTSPQCNIGAKVQTEEVANYNEKYGTSETYKSSNSNNSMQGSNSKQKGRPGDTNSSSNSTYTNSENFEKNDKNISEGNSDSRLVTNVTIMSFLIGGTYYVSEIIETRKNKKKDN